MKIAILGAGNIGAALIGGLLKAKAADAGSLMATTQSEERAAMLRELYGVTVTAGGNREIAHAADVIILGVKPHTVPKVIDEIKDVLREDQILVSLAAVLPIDVLEKRAGRKMAVIRAMPNIPVVVQEGAIALAANSIATQVQRATVERLFRSVGVVCWVEDDMMDAVTALSGSGPAYVYMVIEAFIAGGVKMGLSREISTRLSEQTVSRSRHARAPIATASGNPARRSDHAGRHDHRRHTRARAPRAALDVDLSDRDRDQARA